MFLSPLLFGVVGCLPLLMDFFFYRSPGKMLGVDSVWTAVIPAAMVLAIFAAVTALDYRQDYKLCSEMNQALRLMKN